MSDDDAAGLQRSPRGATMPMGGASAPPADRLPMEAIMTETDGGVLIVLALVLLALNAVRADACRAWLRDHLSPWWQRIRHH